MDIPCWGTFFFFYERTIVSLGSPAREWLELGSWDGIGWGSDCSAWNGWFDPLRCCDHQELKQEIERDSGACLAEHWKLKLCKLELFFWHMQIWYVLGFWQKTSPPACWMSGHRQWFSFKFWNLESDSSTCRILASPFMHPSLIWGGCKATAWDNQGKGASCSSVSIQSIFEVRGWIVFCTLQLQCSLHELVKMLHCWEEAFCRFIGPSTIRSELSAFPATFSTSLRDLARCPVHPQRLIMALALMSLGTWLFDQRSFSVSVVPSRFASLCFALQLSCSSEFPMPRFSLSGWWPGLWCWLGSLGDFATFWKLSERVDGCVWVQNRSK